MASRDIKRIIEICQEKGTDPLTKDELFLLHREADKTTALGAIAREALGKDPTSYQFFPGWF